METEQVNQAAGIPYSWAARAISPTPVIIMRGIPQVPSAAA